MAEEEQDDIDPSADSTLEADVNADEEQRKRFNPQLVVYPLMMIVATVMAAGIPLLLYSEKNPENETSTIDSKATENWSRLNDTRPVSLADENNPLEFNTRDIDPQQRRFTVDLILDREQAETLKSTDESLRAKWEIIKARAREICILVLSNQTAEDLHIITNQERYSKLILTRLNLEIFSLPEYSDQKGSIKKVSIRGLLRRKPNPTG
ncbi:MAG: hypothetical protein QGI86_11880 [Candidatus Poribacteria bacterium]|jgi:flagellar basal body-associated protein FliL|nr:hypothetical protein [Candidatus Poribacteria bacterium]